MAHEQKSKAAPRKQPFVDERLAQRHMPEVEENLPSQFKNNQQQMAQPTGHGVAGGTVPPVGSPGNELAPEPNAMVGVTLNNNYVPLGDRYAIVTSPTPPADFSGNKPAKLQAGASVWLPADEAKTLIDDGRATANPR